MAARSAAQSAKLDKIVEGVKKMASMDSGEAKSILEDLGTIQEASRSANQLMSQKAELDSRIGAIGKNLIIEYMYLQVRG